MDEATLVSKLLPPAIPDDVKLEYAKDGKPPVAGEPHPERVWVRFKVTKEMSVPLSAEEIESLKQRGEEPGKGRQWPADQENSRGDDSDGRSRNSAPIDDLGQC